MLCFGRHVCKINVSETSTKQSYTTNDRVPTSFHLCNSISMDNKRSKLEAGTPGREPAIDDSTSKLSIRRVVRRATECHARSRFAPLCHIVSHVPPSCNFIALSTLPTSNAYRKYSLFRPKHRSDDYMLMGQHCGIYRLSLTEDGLTYVTDFLP